MNFFGIIKTLVIGGLLYWLVDLLPLKEPFPQIIRVVVIIAVVFWLVPILLAL